AFLNVIHRAHRSYPSRPRVIDIAGTCGMLRSRSLLEARVHPAVLKLFLEVADLGSFSKAAIARRTVQSHVSRQISELERECGARLFRRTGRGVVLTELGQQILPRVRASLAEMDQLVNRSEERRVGKECRW